MQANKTRTDTSFRGVRFAFAGGVFGKKHKAGDGILGEITKFTANGKICQNFAEKQQHFCYTEIEVKNRFVNRKQVSPVVS